MLKHRSQSVLVVLLALAVGYLGGVARRASDDSATTAGPTLVTPNQSAPYATYTGNADGTMLVVWRLTDGIPQSATAYTLQSRGKEAGGDYLGVAPFPLLPVTGPK